MNILIAVHHFPPNYIGGAEWRAFRTAQALQMRGYGVRVVCVERIDHAIEASNEGYKPPLVWVDEVYEGVPVRKLFFNMKDAPDPFRWEYDNPWIGDHLQGMLREYRPDIFHMIGGYLLSGSALRAAHKLGVPTLLSLTDFWFLCKRISMYRSDGQVSSLPIDLVTCARCLGEEKRRFRWFGKLMPGMRDIYWRMQKSLVNELEQRQQFLQDTLDLVNVILSPSQFLQNTYIQFGVRPEKITFARQGRDFPGLNYETLEKTPSSVLRVGYIGQITEIKGPHVLIRAIRRLENHTIHGLIYGDPAPFPKYASTLRKIIGPDERIHMMGSYRNEDLSEVMRNLDVIVVPSLWYENSPNVILEAFAHKTPVIASNLGGMAELVRDGENGMLFEPGNAQDLAFKLSQILQEPELLERLRKGISSVKSIEEEIDEMEQLYQFLMEGEGLATGVRLGSPGRDRRMATPD